MGWATEDPYDLDTDPMSGFTSLAGFPQPWDRAPFTKGTLGTIRGLSYGNC
jgi:hypothetical protein